jgi:hypothetical protein
MSEDEILEFIQTARTNGKLLHSIPLLRQLDMEMVDKNFDLRLQVTKILYRTFSLADRPLIHFILQQGIGVARWSPHQDVPLDLKLCIIMLYKLKQAEDSILIWKAKFANYDTFVSIDGQFLVGAGVQATLDYLRSSNELKSLPKLVEKDGRELSIVDYIESDKSLGKVDTIERLEESILNFEVEITG